MSNTLNESPARSGLLRQLTHPSAGAISVYLVIVIILLTGVTFGPLLMGGLTHPDDRTYRAEMARPLSWTWPELKGAFGRVHYPPGTGGYYQPLSCLSLMLDNRLAGYTQARVFQYHFTNIWLHAMNAAMLFLLLRRVSERFAWSLLPALLFAMHPVMVETVASAAHRMTLLGTFFSLLAIHSHLSHAEAVRAGRRGLLTLAGTTLFYAAAVLCKGTFVALPVMLLLLDVWPLKRNGKAPLVEKLPIFVIALAGIIVQVILRRQVPAVLTADAGAAELIARNWGSFLMRLVRPSHLSASYPVFGDGEGWTNFTAAAGFLTILLLSWRIHRAVFVGVAGMLVFVGPALLNVPFNENLLGDSYLYVALIAPLIAAAAFAGSLPRRAPGASQRVAIVCVSGVVLLLGVTAFGRTFAWQNTRELYQQVVKQYPGWARGRVRLVEACIAQNELDAALVQAEKAVELAPNDPSTQFYLGTVLLLHGDSRCAEAIGPLRRALMSNTNWIECLQNLGVALARSGKLEEAIGSLEKARDLAPDSVGIRIALGNAYLQAHRAASARSEFQEALRRRTDPDIHLGLAVAWAANDMPEMARKHLAAAVAEDPRMAMRAARYPELLRLRGASGFGELIDASRLGEPIDPARAVDLETARSSGGP